MSDVTSVRQVTPVAAGSWWKQDGSLLTTDELASMIGATRRQLDYWQRNGVFGKVAHPGSGNSLGWHRSGLPVYRAVAAVSRAFSYGNERGRASMTTAELLRWVVDHYPAGKLDLGHGVAITWKVEQ